MRVPKDGCAPDRRTLQRPISASTLAIEPPVQVIRSVPDLGPPRGSLRRILISASDGERGLHPMKRQTRFAGGKAANPEILPPIDDDGRWYETALAAPGEPAGAVAPWVKDFRRRPRRTNRRSGCRS